MSTDQKLLDCAATSDADATCVPALLLGAHFGSPRPADDSATVIRRFIHDSNNLLLIISLNLEEALEILPASHPLHETLLTVLNAADASVDLNAKLLARVPKRR